jgi:hypothetical protein
MGGYGPRPRGALRRSAGIRGGGGVERVGEDDDGVHHHPEVLGQSCPVGSEPRAVCGVGPTAQADEVTYRARQRNHVGAPMM